MGPKSVGCDIFLHKPLEHRFRADGIPTADASSPRKVQSINEGFFRLPREVRELVYFAILRPDCKLRTPGHCKLSKYVAHHCEDSYRGCINILAACSQTYEGVEVLQAHENKILIDHHRTSIFREPKDHPLSGHFGRAFDDNGEYTACRYTELQFLRFRHVEILLHCPGQPVGGDGQSNAEFERMSLQVHEIMAAIKKARTLRSIRLQIEPKPSFLQSGAKIRRLLQPLVQTALDLHITLFAEQKITWRYGLIAKLPDVWALQSYVEFEPLVDWVNGEAALSRLRGSPRPDYRVLDTTKTFSSLEKARVSLVTAESYVSYFSRSFLHCKAPAAPYSLQPECRSCYQVFSLAHHLASHLDDNPTHRSTFHKKEPNVLDQKIRYNTTQALRCPTCAKQFDKTHGRTSRASPYEDVGKTALFKHMRDRYHYRFLSRWKCDELTPLCRGSIVRGYLWSVAQAKWEAKD